MLRVRGDSKFIIKQVNSEFTLKEISLVPNHTTVQRLIKSFEDTRFEHNPPAHDTHADVTAMDEVVDVSIIKRTLRTTAMDIIPATVTNKQGRRVFIIQIAQPSSTMAAKDLKVFTMLRASFTIEVVVALWPEPCHVRGQERIARRSKTFMKTMTSIFTDACKGKDTTDVCRDKAAELQYACPQCQQPLDTREFLFVQSVGDWRQPQLDFLLH